MKMRKHVVKTIYNRNKESKRGAEWVKYPKDYYSVNATVSSKCTNSLESILIYRYFPSVEISIFHRFIFPLPNPFSCMIDAYIFSASLYYYNGTSAAQKLSDFCFFHFIFKYIMKLINGSVSNDIDHFVNKPCCSFCGLFLFLFLKRALQSILSSDERK